VPGAQWFLLNIHYRAMGKQYGSHKLNEIQDEAVLRDEGIYLAQ
jgi:hypothetical protein